MAIVSSWETRVNTFTDNDQQRAQVTALSGGGWVVTWASDWQDGDQAGVYLQAYNADGSARGDEIRVNSYSTNTQDYPQITALADGRWVVTWLSAGQDSDGSTGVRQQVYNADGSPYYTELQVNTTLAGNQIFPQIKALADGGWVVMWQSNDLGDGGDIYQQAFNANGSVRGGEVRVNTHQAGTQESPQISVLADGGWVVTWMSEGQDGAGWGIYQQAYSANGTARGGEVRVNNYTTGDQDAPQITGLSGGGWVVTWTSGTQGGDGSSDVYQRIYKADGQSGEVRVNSTVTGEQDIPQVTALSGGGWVVTWASYAQDGDGFGVYQQAYNADGSKLGGEILVNSQATGDQDSQEVVALTGGGWVVTWRSSENSAWGTVYQQVYNADGSARGGEIAVSSGTTRLHTITALSGDRWMVTWQQSDGGQNGVYQRVFSFGNTGTARDDYLIGAEGAETLSGGAGDDAIEARGGHDTLDGGAGADWLDGGLGNDIYVTDGIDAIIELANQGTDTVRSSVSYTLGSNLENLVLTGSALTGTGNTLNNVITGNALANTLNGGTGADRLVGELGNDTYVTDGGDTIVEAANQGTDTVRSSVAYTLGANLENLVLAGAALTGTGNTLDNAITGNALANTLDGGSGNDTLDGGTGADRLVGGLGNDIYVTDGGDTIVELASQGTDTVRSSVSYTLGANLENLVLTGTALTGTGNTLDNAITGNGAANTLTGGSGNDTLNGGTGADRLVGGVGNDTYVTDGGDSIVELAGQGTDTVRSSISYTLGANLENLVLTGLALTGTGNTLDNAITGNGAANTLTGGSGNDMLNGGTGADRLVGGIGNDTFVTDGGDTIVEAAGQGIDTVRSSVSHTLGSNLENLVLTGAALTGTGNTLNNVITGNGLANTLNGGTGADRLAGGLGDDIYVTDGGDAIVEAAGQGTDTVRSSLFYTLGSNLENLILTGSALTGTGNSLDNVITGNGAANTLTGGSGNDTLNGGAGADRLVGGLGNDLYETDGRDTIVELANQGTDTVRSGVSHTLGANLENLILRGSGLTGTGNTLANLITGEGYGNTFAGGSGNDTYITDGGDIIVEATGHGTDTVRSSASYALGANLENLVLTGSALTGSGNDLNNVITGNGAANTLSGGAGDDVLFGGAGKDVLTGGVGKDAFVFNAALGSTNIDTLTDFNAVDDTIRLENAVFTKLTATGALASSAFVKNTSGLAADANDRIIYETDTGKLFYDADGSGAGGTVHFATLRAGLALTHADFLVV